MKATILIAVLLAAGISLSSARAVTIDMVPIGNPGNAPDTRYNGVPMGSVGYNYEIGKYEVTAGQYTEFLNAVAKDDPNQLYSTYMGDPGASFGANIQRSGTSPNFSYSVAADWANRPANYVSFWDAARFANWLDNGQPIGAQGPGTTDGGAYHDIGNPTMFGRNAGAKFFIPTENEWHKAAYHDKTAGLAASYFDVPTGTNASPGNNINETTNPGNNVNYNKIIFGGNHTIGSPYWRTIVGEFELSDSPYGTFDQGGNVWEWNETSFPSGFAGNSARGIRGGSFYSPDGIGAAAGSMFNNNDPRSEGPTIGFRVARIPEPNSALLVAMASLGLLLRRWC